MTSSRRKSAHAPASLVWFRHDLRLADQPALAAALAAGGPVLPVFIWAPEEEGAWAPGAASRWWLHHALADLDAQLRRCGSRLLVRAGPSAETLRTLARDTGAKNVFWCRRGEPAARARDEQVAAALRAAGVAVATFNGTLVHEPPSILNQAGRPFQVFTPFWRAFQQMPGPDLVRPPRRRLRGLAPAHWPASAPLETLGLRPRIPWDREFYAAWTPTQAGAQRRLKQFAARAAARYAARRDVLGADGTSRLSPYLHWGQLSPRQVWRAVAGRAAAVSPGAAVYLKELGWREFAHHLLHHFPATPAAPLRADFARFPWRRDARLLRVWQRGETGYPVVDAAMRQLWRTGWMHNRARMIVASFLVKHLLQPWQAGAAWFWDTLVDADLANNTLGWQWAAGCGADAAPYFRIFNPLLQGARFDADGAYVRAWVPELARLPAQFLHAPWTAPAAVLRAAGVALGENYPRPVVEHGTARRRALQAFDKLRGL